MEKITSFEKGIEILSSLKSACIRNVPAPSNINRDNEWLFWEVLHILDHEVSNNCQIEWGISSLIALLNEEQRLFCSYNYEQFKDQEHFNYDFRSEFPHHTTNFYMKWIEILYSRSDERYKGILFSIGRLIFNQRNEVLRGGWLNKEFVSFLNHNK